MKLSYYAFFAPHSSVVLAVYVSQGQSCTASRFMFVIVCAATQRRLMLGSEFFGSRRGNMPVVMGTKKGFY